MTEWFTEGPLWERCWLVFWCLLVAVQLVGIGCLAYLVVVQEIL